MTSSYTYQQPSYLSPRVGVTGKATKCLVFSRCLSQRVDVPNAQPEDTDDFLFIFVNSAHSVNELSQHLTDLSLPCSKNRHCLLFVPRGDPNKKYWGWMCTHGLEKENDLMTLVLCRQWFSFTWCWSAGRGTRGERREPPWKSKMLKGQKYALPDLLTQDVRRVDGSLEQLFTSAQQTPAPCRPDGRLQRTALFTSCFKVRKLNI